MYNCCIIVFSSSHSAPVSCNLLDETGHTGAATGTGTEKLGVAWDARLKGKAEAEEPISGMLSIASLSCEVVNPVVEHLIIVLMAVTNKSFIIWILQRNSEDGASQSSRLQVQLQATSTIG